jgi:hypothetical protein
MIGFVAPGYCQDRPASATDTTALTALPTWTPTGNLNTSRYGHTATLLPGGKVLVAGGGEYDVGSHNSAELYDIATGTWSFTGSLSSVRFGHTATLLKNGKVLVVGGTYGRIPIAELYDPATGTWSPTGSPAFVYWWNTATLLPSGKVLIVWDVLSARFWEEALAAELYDPATGTWGPAAKPASIYSPGTATLLQDGKVLVGRGIYWYSDQSVPASAEVYDPVSDSWRRVDDSICNDWSTATLLPNGKVLMAGGEEFYWGVGLYDPAAEACFYTGDLIVDRTAHTATLLPNGKVLVAGGYGSDYGTLKSAELYDPSTGIWTSTSSLNAGRVGHTATLLPDGRVLVAGGLGLDSAEIYDPVPGPSRPDFGLYRKLTPRGNPYYRFLLDFNFDHVPDAKIPFGTAGDVPLVGRIDPGGKTSLIIYRNGLWYIDANRDGTVDVAAAFGGMAGDIPLTANFSGSGALDDLVIYRAGLWYVDRGLDGVAELMFVFGGVPGDVPLAADVNGDGFVDLVIYRGGTWYVSTARDGTANLRFYFGGMPQDRPLLFDWDGDGQVDLCIFRDGIWYVSTKRDGVADMIFGYGAPGDLPLVGEF